MRATFPHHLLHQEVVPRFVGTSLEPQRSISGAETVVPSLGGHWEVDCTFVIRGEAAQLAWQAFLAQMEGRIGTTLVPIRSRYRPRDNRGRSVSACNVAPIEGAQTWEHFGFENAPVAVMSLAQPAALRATTIKVVANNSTGLRPGQMFSIGGRLYRVQNHWQDGDGTSNLMIQPPLRQAFTAAALILDRPVCPMRFATEDEGSFDHLLDPMPRVTCRFVEAV